jgi:hypothetical protein
LAISQEVWLEILIYVENALTEIRMLLGGIEIVYLTGQPDR